MNKILHKAHEDGYLVIDSETQNALPFRQKSNKVLLYSSTNHQLHAARDNGFFPLEEKMNK